MARPRSRWDQIGLRSLLTMELFDSLVDDETLVRQAETPVAAVVASHCELRTRTRICSQPWSSRTRRLTEVARQVPPSASVRLSVITSAGAGGLLALARHKRGERRDCLRLSRPCATSMILPVAQRG